MRIEINLDADMMQVFRRLALRKYEKQRFDQAHSIRMRPELAYMWRIMAPADAMREQMRRWAMRLDACH